MHRACDHARDHAHDHARDHAFDHARDHARARDGLEHADLEKDTYCSVNSREESEA